jgi:hypothetical protein
MLTVHHTKWGGGVVWRRALALRIHRHQLEDKDAEAAVVSLRPLPIKSACGSIRV